MIGSVFIKLVNVQLSIELDTTISGNNLNDVVQNKVEIRERIDNLFQVLETENPDFIVFPEYSYFDELHELLIDKSNSMQTIIISGSYINTELIPELKVYLPNGNVELVQKNSLSPDEYKQFTNISLKGGTLPGIFTINKDNREVTFLILICYDFYAKYHKYFETNLDLLFIPAFNPKNERFYAQINEFCFQNPSFVSYCNAAGEHTGNSAIFGHYEEYLHIGHRTNGQISNLNLDKETLIANLSGIENSFIISEVDINRPYLIRPNGIIGNNAPNIKNIRKYNL